MKKLILLSVCALGLSSANAQTYQWAKRSGAAGNDVALAVTTDATGNVYVTGYFNGTVDIDPGPASLNLISAGGQDCFISKFNSSGSLIWAKQIGGSSLEQGNSIFVDASNNVYVGGTWCTTVDFDPGAGIDNRTVSGATDAFILKLDASGNYVWASCFSGTGNEQVLGLTVDGSGNVYSTGFWYETCDFDPGAGTYSIQASVTNTNSSCFISKLNASGAFLWAGEIGGGQFHEGHGIAVDGTGNVYVGGYFIGGTDFDPGAGVYSIPLGSGGSEDAFVCKLTTAGAFVAAVKFAGTGVDRCNALALDASGNVVVTGFYSGTADLDPGAGTANATSVGLKDIFVAKLTSSLVYVWSASFGGTADDIGNAVMSDASDNVYSVGYFQNTADFNPGAGTANLVSSGNYDAYLSKLTSAGAYSNAYKFGGTVGDYGFGLNVDGPANNIYSCGHFGGTCDFDPGAGVANLVSAGTQDLFIQKMGFCVVPTAPTSSNTSVCYNSTASLTATGTGTLGWYSAASGGTYLGGGSNYTTPALTATTSYFVQDSTCGASTRTQVTVTVNAQITTSVSSVTNVACNGGSNGAASITVGGGTLPYTYSWAPSGGTAASITGRTSGTYTCTITDGVGCTRTQTLSITQPSALTSNITAQNPVACFGGSSGMITVAAAGGAGGYTYAWSPSGGTSATASGLTANSYTCTITDANGCTRTQTATITQPATALTSSVTSVTNVACNGNATGGATISASGGTTPYSYSWSPGGGTAPTISGRTAGTYTCIITDVNNCTSTQTVNITQPTVITSSVSSLTNVLCNNSATGAATVTASGGASGYTYVWAPTGGTSATATGLIATNYTCTITDANGCTTNQTVTITEPTAIASSVSSQSNVSCNGGSDGSATVFVSGGAGSYTYSWAPNSATTASVSGLSFGTYSCTVTDANGCTRLQLVNITQPTTVTASVSSQTDPLCNGANNGSITASASGGTGTLAYLWSPIGGTSSTAAAIGAGTYTCTVTDINGCSATVSATLGEPAPLVATLISQASPTCFGGNDGTATVDVIGGTAAYTYAWSPSGGNGATGNGLSIGTFTCTIMDANGCTQTQSVFITQPAAIGSSQTVNVCYGNSFTVGVSTYTATGVYSDVFTALNGCDSTVTTDLTINNAIDVTTTTAGNTISSNENGATYQWIDCLNGNAPVAGETNQSFTPTVSGDYAVIVTVGSCSDTSACTNVITGIQLNGQVAFNIYPNPTNGDITITLNQAAGDAQIEIFNAIGQLVNTEKPLNNTVTVSLPADTGIYLVRVTTNGISTTQKVIKE